VTGAAWAARQALDSNPATASLVLIDMMVSPRLIAWKLQRLASISNQHTREIFVYIYNNLDYTQAVLLIQL
jgi:hypothetical protein